MQKAPSEKNRKNVTQRKGITQLLTEGLCCRHRSKKLTFFVHVEKIFFERQELPQHLLHSFTFDKYQGLSSLQTLLLSLSPCLVPHHSHTITAAQWMNLKLPPVPWVFRFIFFYNKLLRLSNISESQNKCRFWSFLVILPSYLLNWKYV